VFRFWLFNPATLRLIPTSYDFPRNGWQNPVEGIRQRQLGITRVGGVPPPAIQDIRALYNTPTSEFRSLAVPGFGHGLVASFKKESHLIDEFKDQ
jgi:hypothetical protein